jgi:nitrile hydratase
MNGVHDLGGTDGLGPVLVEANEPVWHSEWEKVAFGMFPFPYAAGFFGVDQFRYAIEQMHPAEYLASRYYEHWLHAAEHYGTTSGALDPAEIERRAAHYLAHPDEPLPDTKSPDLVAFAEAAVKSGVTARRESDATPKYAVGDRVRVTDDSPRGHTRKARYIRGRRRNCLAHGTFIYPDSAGNGLGDDPQHVYTVRFDARRLWERSGDPNVPPFVSTSGSPTSKQQETNDDDKPESAPDGRNVFAHRRGNCRPRRSSRSRSKGS